MPRLLLVALLVAVGLLASTGIRPAWTIDPDASLYVGLGRALAAGDGYSLDDVPHTKYPPGLPVLLAGLISASGPEAYGVFHGALVLVLLGAVALTYFLVRRLGYGAGVALAVAAATGLSQTLFDLSVVYLRTEVLFLLITLGAQLALQRALEPGGGAGAAVGAALLCVAAMSVRMAGVALLAVPLLGVVLPAAPPPDRRGVRLRGLVILAACGAALVAWQARGHAVAEQYPGVPDYSAEFLALEPRDLTKTVQLDAAALDVPGLVRRVTGNLGVLTRATAVLLTNVDRAGSRLPVGILLLTLVLIGLAGLLRAHPQQARRRQAVAYAVALVGLCLVWPFNQQERFYVPLLPLLLLAAGEGICRVLALARAFTVSLPGRRTVLLAAGALLLLLGLQRSDHPTLLGRWSWSYAALLAAGLGGWILMFRMLRRGPLPEPSRWLLLLAPALLAVPWLHHRFVEWPAQVRAFDARRAADPQPGPLARIDVDPRLESVAVFLRDHTPPGTILMTDVPAMLQIMSGRRCIPFVYQEHPPDVRTGSADLVFYTREIPEAAAVMDAVAPRLQPVFALPPVEENGRSVIPTVFRAR